MDVRYDIWYHLRKLQNARKSLIKMDLHDTLCPLEVHGALSEFYGMNYTRETDSNLQFKKKWS